MFKKTTAALCLITAFAIIGIAGYQTIENHLTIAEANTSATTCDPAKDLTGFINNTDYSKATITNKSLKCSYSVGYAAYHTYDSSESDPNYLKDQVLFSHKELTIAPNKTITIELSSTDCDAQYDLFYGDLLTSLSQNKLYGNRKLDFVNNFSKGVCTKTPPPPAKPPVPTVSSVCIDNSEAVTITVNWSDASQGAQGYHVNFTSNSNFDNGGWAKILPSGTTHLTVSDFNNFKAFGNAPGNLTLSQGKTYKVQVYYPATNGLSDVVSVTAANNCKGTPTPTPPTPPVPPTLSGSCVASSSNVNIGSTVTYTAIANGGNGSYSYSWSGSDNISGAAQSMSHTFWAYGVQNAQVVITSNGQSVTANCSTTVLGGGGGGGGGGYIIQPNLSAVCSVTPSTVSIGQTVTWRATASNGNGAYTYSWTGTDNLQSYVYQAITSYSTIGQKQATVTVSSNGQSVSQTCYVNVVSAIVPPPTGGIYLSQVPYTGIGSNLKVALFILALIAWSAIISYILIKRKADKSGMTIAQLINGPRTPVLGLSGMSAATAFATSQNNPNVIDERIAGLREKMEKNTVASTATFAAPRSTFIEQPVKVEPVASPFVMPETHAAFPSTHETVIESLEMKARELQTLISADGLEVIAQASNNNKHNALIILNHLVELYKGSDHEMNGEWMVLNGEKINKMLFSTYITMTPVFIQWLAEGDDRKILAFMRMLQMQGQSIGNFVTNIVMELNKAYQFRMENTGDANTKILDLTMAWSDEELEYAIHTLVSAVDQTSTSTYSSVKVALIKIIEIAKAKIYA